MNSRILRISAAIAVLFFISTTAADGAPDSKSERAKTVKMVKDAVESRDITVEINTILPLGSPSIPTTDGYTIVIKDGMINGRLPYFGTGHSALIAGVDETGIVFEDCPIEIEEDNSKASKGKCSWSFSAVSGSERIDVYMEIWDSGSVNINCNCARRSAISYIGDIRL